MRYDDSDGANRTEQRPSRRAVLGAVGAAAGIALAGCSGGGGGGETTSSSGGSGSGNDGGGGGSNGGGGGDSTEGGGGGGSGGGTSGSAADAYSDPCPSPPFSYSRSTYESPNSQVASFAVDTPEFAQVRTTGGVAFNFGNADTTTNASAATNQIYESVSALRESLADAYEETTGEYDLRPSDARSFTQNLEGSVSIWQTTVTWPVDQGVMSVRITFNTGGEGDGCSEAASAIQTRMVESVGPA
jgi:hypothetical protein